MVKSLTGFFKENAADPILTKELIVSHRFKDENGEPIKWEIKQLAVSEIEAASDAAIKINRQTKEAEFKSALYSKLLAAAAVVYPNLNNAELQDSYGVQTPEALLTTMLNAAEYDLLVNEVTAFNKLNQTFEDKVDEVKN